MEIIGLIVIVVIGVALSVIAAGAWPQLINAIWPPRMVSFTYHRDAGVKLNVEFRRVWCPLLKHRLTFNRSPKTSTEDPCWIETTTGRIPSNNVVHVLNGMAIVGANLELEYADLTRLGP